ncbi:uncharacterized protein [Arachis hypogaea]|uniref:uncharacterized protein n=1 Tax=Arachis hypogaea TaxID=3818 RepID=UPI003B20CF89
MDGGMPELLYGAQTALNITPNTPETRNRNKIPENRTAGIGTDHHGKEITTLLPESHNNSTNRPTPKIDINQTRARGTINQWSVELSEFDIQYESRKTLKSQVLADFVSEMTNETQPTEASWSIHVDGASNREGSGIVILLKEGDKVIAEQSLQFRFNASNNQAEYEALLAGLKLAQQLKIPRITVYCDSSLVVHQIKGEYQVKDPLLEKYWLITKNLISKFSKFEIIHVNREQNTRADVLSKLATTRQTENTPALSQLTLDKPSFEQDTVLSIMQVQDWRTPFLNYINTDEDTPNHSSNASARIRPRKLQQKHTKGSAKTTSGAEHWQPKYYEQGTTGQQSKETVRKSQGMRQLSKARHRFRNPSRKATYHRGFKEKARRTKGEWADLIPEILWSYNTTIQSATGETPFKLVYGAEAIIPVEVGIPTIRTEFYNQQSNSYARTTELDLMEEERDISAIRQRAMKKFIERRHNRRVAHRSFNEGDLVLRRTKEARKPPAHEKLAANWERPL